MRSLVVGLGIGQLYEKILKEMGSDVDTLDLDKSRNPTFSSYDELEDGYFNHRMYDTVHICTPNHTHEPIFNKLVRMHDRAIYFIEKPGFKDQYSWSQARFDKHWRLLVKNNQYRDNIDEIKELSNQDYIHIMWINKDRVPSPGSWFTNKSLSWGGVSRDLLPHLLSYIPVLFPRQYNLFQITHIDIKRKWNLSDLSNTGYGSINPDGVYDVDDYCNIRLEFGNKIIDLTADWRSNNNDYICINSLGKTIELGLCPESAYKNMINAAVSAHWPGTTSWANIYWNQEMKQDLWIHKIIDEVSKTFDNNQ